VAPLHVASWQAAYAGILDPTFLAGLSVEEREESWRQILAAGESEPLVGLEGSAIVGFASLGRSRDVDAPQGRGGLRALYVHPRSWSTGAGRQLWHAARTRLHCQGFSSVSVWVLQRNTRAIIFYSAIGFAVDPGSEREFDLGSAVVRKVRMVHAS
jgi:ribosomal protein S18 acetylase RimI-like enzyme